MSTDFFRKYINLLEDQEVQQLRHGDFEQHQLQPTEMQKLTGKTVNAWAQQLGLDLSKIQTGLFTLNGGVQAPAVNVGMPPQVDPETMDEMKRALGSIGITVIPGGIGLYLVLNAG
jgi:hypothetical protein